MLSWLATHGADHLLGADLCSGRDPTEPSAEANEQLSPTSGLEAGVDPQDHPHLGALVSQGSVNQARNERNISWLWMS